MTRTSSRLARLRGTQQYLWASLAFTSIVLGSISIQRIGQGQSDRALAARQQAVQQQEADASLEAVAEAKRRAAIEANAEGWRLWQAHAGARCAAVVTKLEKNRSYLGASLGKGRLVYDGLIICDRDYVGILKGPQLVPAWVVPRPGSKYPLPGGDPPPEFRPLPAIEPVNPINNGYSNGEEKLLQKNPVQPSPNPDTASQWW